MLFTVHSTHIHGTYMYLLHSGKETYSWERTGLVDVGQVNARALLTHGRGDFDVGLGSGAGLLLPATLECKFGWMDEARSNGAAASSSRLGEGRLSFQGAPEYLLGIAGLP